MARKTRQPMTQASKPATSPAASSVGSGRLQRSDARRNVAALVRAAKAVFATSGVDAPAKEITDRAGVGIGTLYRHFPRRSELIIAVLQHEIDDCIEVAEQLRTSHDPWHALASWIGRYTEFVGTKSGLAVALHSGDPAYDDLPQHLLDRLEPALQTLLTRARAAEDVRQDVTARDLLLTVALMCQPVPGEGLQFNERMLSIFMQGLRAI